MAVYVTEPTVEQEYIYNLLNHISGISYYISAIVNPILYRLVQIELPLTRACRFTILTNGRAAAQSLLRQISSSFQRHVQLYEVVSS